METYTTFEVLLGLFIIGFALVVPIYQTIKQSKYYTTVELLASIFSILSILLLILAVGQ
jgi:uncharacterized membrane protein